MDAAVGTPRPPSPSPSPRRDGAEGPEVLELVVVGAGPHALALIARLLDERPNTQPNFEVGALPKPSGLREGMRQLFDTPRCGANAVRALLACTAIVDPSGRWLSQWDKAFSALQIRLLRSSFEMHPCIFDAFALQSFAKKKRLDKEWGTFMTERTKVNMKTMFAMPSSEMFLEFCAHLVDLYGLRTAVHADRATKLMQRDDGLIRVSLLSGKSLLAKRVVVATGPTTVPRVPAWANGLWRPSWAPAAGTAVDDESYLEDAPDGAIAHAWELISQSDAGGVPRDGAPIPPRSEKAGATWSARLDANPRLLIVGGGLTAVHLLQRAVHVHNCEHVHLVSRADDFLEKQFDINLDWVSYTTRPGRMATFRHEKDPAKRLEMLRAARGRGSITPEARAHLDATLRDAEERAGADECRISVEMGATIDAATWLSAEEAGSTAGEWEVYMGDGSTRRYDVIWLATGSNLDVRADPLLGDLLKHQPVDLAGGLPVLEPTLRWRPGSEVYVMGPFAGLSLGPDALNLTGARTGACRIGAVLRPAIQAVISAKQPSSVGTGERRASGSTNNSSPRKDAADPTAPRASTAMGLTEETTSNPPDANRETCTAMPPC